MLWIIGGILIYGFMLGVTYDILDDSSKLSPDGLALTSILWPLVFPSLIGMKFVQWIRNRKDLGY